MEHSDKAVTKNKLSVDLRIITLGLLIVIVGMLAVWKPWSDASDSGRTISVSGDAKIAAEPDEYTFQPSYEFKDANKDTALAALTLKSNEVVKKLKELGIASSKIKTNSDSYNYDYYFNDTDNDYTYTLRVTAIAQDNKIAQKVQDYLVTTAPTGQISPQTSFSNSKRKYLESKARDDATREAREKADQSAKNLGFKVGKIKTFNDGSSYGGIQPMLMSDTVAGSTETKAMSLTIQPGENELTYTVTVVYFVH